MPVDSLRFCTLHYEDISDHHHVQPLSFTRKSWEPGGQATGAGSLGALQCVRADPRSTFSTRALQEFSCNKRCLLSHMTGITTFCVRAAPFLETGGFPKRVIRRPFNRSGTSAEMPSADSSPLTAQSSTLQMSVAQAETVSNGINSLPTSLHGSCSKASQ